MERCRGEQHDLALAERDGSTVDGEGHVGSIGHYGKSDALDIRRFRLYMAVELKRKIVMQVAQWGNSLAVRLPAAVVKALGLKAGDNVEIFAAGSDAFALAKADRADKVDALFERVRALRGSLPADFKFDRLEANER